jgi:hypothetical protein
MARHGRAGLCVPGRVTVTAQRRKRALALCVASGATLCARRAGWWRPWRPQGRQGSAKLSPKHCACGAHLHKHTGRHGRTGSVDACLCVRARTHTHTRACTRARTAQQAGRGPQPACVANARLSRQAPPQLTCERSCDSFAALSAATRSPRADSSATWPASASRSSAIAAHLPVPCAQCARAGLAGQLCNALHQFITTHTAIRGQPPLDPGWWAVSRAAHLSCASCASARSCTTCAAKPACRNGAGTGVAAQRALLADRCGVLCNLPGAHAAPWHHLGQYAATQ